MLTPLRAAARRSRACELALRRTLTVTVPTEVAGCALRVVGALTAEKRVAYDPYDNRTSVWPEVPPLAS